MKRSVKIIILIYIGVAVFTYAIALRTNQLEQQDDYKIQKESIVFKIK